MQGAFLSCQTTFHSSWVTPAWCTQLTGGAAHCPNYSLQDPHVKEGNWITCT